MTARVVQYGDEARQSLQDGRDLLTNAVRTTTEAAVTEKLTDVGQPAVPV